MRLSSQLEVGQIVRGIVRERLARKKAVVKIKAFNLVADLPDDFDPGEVIYAKVKRLDHPMAMELFDIRETLGNDEEIRQKAMAGIGKIGLKLDEHNIQIAGALQRFGVEISSESFQEISDYLSRCPKWSVEDVHACALLRAIEEKIDPAAVAGAKIALDPHASSGPVDYIG